MPSVPEGRGGTHGLLVARLHGCPQEGHLADRLRPAFTFDSISTLDTTDRNRPKAAGHQAVARKKSGQL